MSTGPAKRMAEVRIPTLGLLGWRPRPERRPAGPGLRPERPAQVEDRTFGSVRSCRRGRSTMLLQPFVPASSSQRPRPARSRSGGEQPLDDVIVQVPSDPVSILEQGEALLVSPGVGQLPGQGGVGGERGGHVQVGGGERLASRAAGRSSAHRAPAPTCRERQHHDRPDVDHHRAQVRRQAHGPGGSATTSGTTGRRAPGRRA